jgi:hypothetical protein
VQALVNPSPELQEKIHAARRRGSGIDLNTEAIAFDTSATDVADAEAASWDARFTSSRKR